MGRAVEQLEVCVGSIAQGEKRPRILLVDDDGDVRTAINWMLRQMNCEVSEAADGFQAINSLEREEVDIVLLDLLMPNKDGIETLKEIRNRWPKVKVVAISGGGFYCHAGLTLNLSLKLGAVLALEKPFSCDELNSAIRFALGEIKAPAP